MTIQKVRPNGWPLNSTLTSGEISQIDENAASAIAKTGTDTVYSQLTFTTNSELTFDSGSALILDPSAVTIQPGTLKVGAEIIGDESQSDPLRFGLARVTLSSGTYTLSADEYNRGIIVLSGTLSGDTTVVFPNCPITTGYSKIIDNRATGDYSVKLKASSQSDSDAIEIENGKSAVIYVHYESLRLAAVRRKNYVERIISKSEATDYTPASPKETLSAGASLTGLTDAFTATFNSVEVGDKFEISATVTMSCPTVTSPPIDAKSVVVYNIGGSDIEITSTQFRVYGTLTADDVFQGTVFTVFEATSADPITFELMFQPDSTNDLDVLSPLSFIVKQIKA